MKKLFASWNRMRLALKTWREANRQAHLQAGSRACCSHPPPGLRDRDQQTAPR